MRKISAGWSCYVAVVLGCLLLAACKPVQQAENVAEHPTTSFALPSTSTLSPSPSLTLSPAPSNTPTSTATLTSTPSATATPTSTLTPRSTNTPTASATPTSAPTATSTPLPPLARLCFFFDKNLSSHRDGDEPLLSQLNLRADGYHKVSQDSCLMLPQKQASNVHVSGLAPNGKELLSATFMEPQQVVLLPDFAVAMEASDRLIGLSDGYCTAAIKPDQLNWNSYNDVLARPDWFTNHIKELKLYPPHAPSADAEPNWFFYGYYNPGPRHLALDVWAVEGTEVHAPVPGKIVKGNYDHVVGIRGPYGQFDLNHFQPSVAAGSTVKRGDAIGTVDAGGHVHLELYSPANAPTGNRVILSCFPGLGPQDILVSPVDGKPVPVLPYFGQ